MKQFLICTFLCLASIASYAQEEFYRDKGGITLHYGHSYADVVGHFNSVGVGFLFKNGLALGVSNQPIADQVKPQLYLGYMSKPKTDNFYARANAQLSYISSSFARIIGGNFGLSYLLNGQKQFPSSLNGVFSINHIKLKKADSNIYFTQADSEIVPAMGCAFNQAFFAHYTLTPFISIGVAHELKNNTTGFSLSMGININFNGAVN